MKLKTCLFFILISLMITSCSCEKERLFTEREMWYKAKKQDPKVELVAISNSQIEKRILCKNYGPKCIKRSGRRILVSTVELIAVGFETEAAARTEALRIGQWYAYNWVFDDVSNEPVLIDFIQKAFNAKNAKEEWAAMQEAQK